MNLFHYTQGHVSEGLPVRLLIQGAKALQEQTADRPTEHWQYAVLGWSDEQAENWVDVSRDQQPVPLSRWSAPAEDWDTDARPGLVTFALPAVVRLRPQDEEGAVLNITRSGAYTLTPGADSFPTPVLPTPPDASPLEQQAHAWLRDGRVGSSSYALCVALTGVENPDKPFPVASDTPHDSGDFSRCVAFFEAVPLARPFLESMNQGGPAWQALVPVWDELEQLFAAGQRREVSDRIRDLTSEIELSEDTPFLGRGTQQARRPRP